jgi:RNA polymerase sigma-70 factor (ECF subfamily)
MSQLIREARAGSADALGRLLEGCRAYLLLVANRQLDRDLRAKGGASDLVQETFLEAQHDFPRFEGRTQQDLLGWLRGILRHNVADFRRRYRDRAARQISQEWPLNASVLAGLRDQLVADTPLPEEGAASASSAAAMRRAVARLPEDHRRVIALRHQEGRSFDDIAHEMGRTTGAVRKLWFRAVERLREEMNAPPRAMTMGRRKTGWPTCSPPTTRPWPPAWSPGRSPPPTRLAGHTRLHGGRFPTPAATVNGWGMGRPPRPRPSPAGPYAASLPFRTRRDRPAGPSPAAAPSVPSWGGWCVRTAVSAGVPSRASRWRRPALPSSPWPTVRHQFAEDRGS